MTQNFPQFIDFKKCSSGSRIPGSQFFAGLVIQCAVLCTQVGTGSQAFPACAGGNIGDRAEAVKLVNR